MHEKLDTWSTFKSGPVSWNILHCICDWYFCVYQKQLLAGLTGAIYMANQSVRGVQIDVDCRLALRLDEIMLQLAYLWLASLSMMVTTGNMI